VSCAVQCRAHQGYGVEVANPDPPVKEPLQNMERGVVEDAPPQVRPPVASGGIREQGVKKVVWEGGLKKVRQLSPGAIPSHMKKIGLIEEIVVEC
jgi:hypothetical protein